MPKPLLPGAVLDPASTSINSRWLWFHKGFVEGLKRARAPSESDEKFEDLAYDLAETQVKLEETQTKLDDMTEVLGEKLFREEINENSRGVNNNINCTTSTNSYPSSTSLPSTRTYAESLQQSITPVATSLSARRAIPLSNQRPNSRRSSEAIPGYYSTSEASQTSVDAALGTLIEKAHGGDERSISLIKFLCREAHGTPPERKTYGQRYILARWRNPSFCPRRGRPNTNPSSTSNLHQLINPQSNDPPEAWIAYYTRYPRSLPKGVRVNSKTGAPLFGDIVASRLLARLRPTASQYRAEFNVAMINLFIHQGQFREMVHDGQIQIPPIADIYQPFEPDDKIEQGDLISVLDVARHYAKCGVSIEDVENYVEPWTEEYTKQKYEL
ncbi:hypothetical protein C8R41DRAFT_918741 [Lentinula lateritia]|uniref:Uncharacterized protein n=1 Tax=Lentinula lateritia TaxID=40482 RepID=A0ABQ8VJ00_9AGAR|nr:hypothetical protein C8R41DRAFT_918741 [Lentinula lateritia]